MKDRAGPSPDEAIVAIKKARDDLHQGNIDLRAAILDACENGVTTTRMATELGISLGTLSYWLRTAREERAGTRATPTRTPRPPRG